MKIDKLKKIGTATNYYGGVMVTHNNGKYYWMIECCSNIQDDDFEEIPKYLYDALIKFEQEREK